MKSKLVLLVLIVILATALPAGAVPLANPCVAGGGYNPACDVNQDSAINILDVQLSAGHWNQTGTFTSDNNHNHLGQSWTGASNPLKIQGAFGSPDYAPLVLSNSAGHGLSIPTASINGIYVGTAGAYGMVVNAAIQDGVYVGTAGSPSSSSASSTSNGFEVAGAQGYGLYVGRADQNGVRVTSSGSSGLFVGYAGYHGVNVDGASQSGLYVFQAGQHGVNVAGNNYAGYFFGSIFVNGSCTGCRQANFGVNASGRPLQPGDVVSIQGVTSTDFDAGADLWQVVPTQPGQAAVGVVAGWAELVTESEHRPTETGKRLVPREGAAQPGAYVTIVYSGPMQVKVAPGENISAGMRLTVAADGAARPLGTIKVQLANGAGTADMAESAPVIGVALGPGYNGLAWVLVNPQ